MIYNWSTWADYDITTAGSGPTASSTTGMSSYADSYGEHVFYVGSDGDIHNLYFNGSAWHDFNLSTVTNGPPAATNQAQAGDTDSTGEHAFFVGPSNHLYQMYYNFSAWSAVDLTEWGSYQIAPPVLSTSGLASYADNWCNNVFYVATDSHLHRLCYSQPNWFDVDMTSWSNGPTVANGSALAGYIDSAGKHVFYIPGDGHLHEITLVP